MGQLKGDKTVEDGFWPSLIGLKISELAHIDFAIPVTVNPILFIPNLQPSESLWADRRLS